MSPTNLDMVNLKEFERLLLTNWTTFINPQRLIAFVLSKVRDTELNTIKTKPPKTKSSMQLTISQFRSCPEGFILWVDFVIPKPEGTAVGTCELRFDPIKGSIDHLQTLGNIFNA